MSDPFQPMRLLARVRTPDGTGVVVAQRSRVEFTGIYVRNQVVEDLVTVWYDTDERNSVGCMQRDYARGEVVVLG